MNRVTLIGAAVVGLALATAWTWSRHAAAPQPPANSLERSAPGATGASTTREHSHAAVALATPADALAAQSEGSGPDPASSPATVGASDSGPLPDLAAAWTDVAAQLPEFRAGQGALYAQWRALLDTTLGADEADFYLALMGGGLSWQAMRARIHEQARRTGQDYRELELQLGLNTGEISLAELEQLSASGLPLPDWSVLSLAWQGRIDDIASLATQGHLPDLTARNPLNGNTVLGTFISHAAGGQLPPQEAARRLETLVALGVDTAETTSGQDALMQTLSRAGPSNVDALHAVAERLIRHGHPVTEQHIAAAASISAPAVSERMLRLLGAG